MLSFRVGWVERPFAKPIILREIDGGHYAPKKQALHSTHPTEMCVCLRRYLEAITFLSLKKEAQYLEKDSVLFILYLSRGDMICPPKNSIYIDPLALIQVRGEAVRLYSYRHR